MLNGLGGEKKLRENTKNGLRQNGKHLQFYTDLNGVGEDKKNGTRTLKRTQKMGKKKK